MQKQQYSPLEKRARHISYKQRLPWFICRRPGCSDVVVSETDVKRYLKIGYAPVCAYYKGALYDTVFEAGGEIRFMNTTENPGPDESVGAGIFLMRKCGSAA